LQVAIANGFDLPSEQEDEDQDSGRGSSSSSPPPAPTPPTAVLALVHAAVSAAAVATPLPSNDPSAAAYVTALKMNNHFAFPNDMARKDLLREVLPSLLGRAAFEKRQAVSAAAAASPNH